MIDLAPMDEEHLEAVLAVRLSNSARLARTEGSSGQPGHLDLEMLQRDVAVGAMDPVRRMWVIREAGVVVGLIDALTEHPEDGHPWLGTIEIHRDRRRAGLGRASAEAVLAELAANERPVRCRVDEDDEEGAAFARALGFAPAGGTIWERPASWCTEPTDG